MTLSRGKGDVDANGAVNRNDRQILSEFLTQYHRQNVSSGDTPFNRRCILDYSVTNGGVFKLPHTGSSDSRWIWMVFAFAGMLMSGSVVILSANRRRKMNVCNKKALGTLTEPRAFNTTIISRIYSVIPAY